MASSKFLDGFLCYVLQPSTDAFSPVITLEALLKRSGCLAHEKKQVLGLQVC